MGSLFIGSSTCLRGSGIKVPGWRSQRRPGPFYFIPCWVICTVTPVGRKPQPGVGTSLPQDHQHQPSPNTTASELGWLTIRSTSPASSHRPRHNPRSDDPKPVAEIRYVNWRLHFIHYPLYTDNHK